MQMYVVMTDVDTGKAVYKNLKEGSGIDMLYFRSSGSLPLAARPVEVLGHRYLDGGLSDSLPLRFMQKKGYEKNVVVLTQAPDYKKMPVKHMKVIGAILHKYPEIVKAMAKRHVVYNKELEYIKKCAEKGNAFIIQPEEPLGINHVEHNPDELQRVYDAGRQVMEGKLAALKEFMASDN